LKRCRNFRILLRDRNVTGPSFPQTRTGDRIVNRACMTQWNHRIAVPQITSAESMDRIHHRESKSQTCDMTHFISGEIGRAKSEARDRRDGETRSDWSMVDTLKNGKA